MSLYLRCNVIIIREDVCDKVTIIDSQHDLCLELGADVSFSMNRIVLKQCISKGEIFSACAAALNENEEDHKLNSSNKSANSMFSFVLNAPRNNSLEVNCRWCSKVI